MAKAEKMNRGVSSKVKRGGGGEIKLPPGVHGVDALGNIFASIPEISRVTPKYFSFDEIKTAIDAGKITYSDEDFALLEKLVARK
jgi:hypothetical protein